MTSREVELVEVFLLEQYLFIDSVMLVVNMMHGIWVFRTEEKGVTW